ncbi:TetR/AcrR family transcriptional regulator [Actinomadura madurae]|uniref:TetR/AcrR family transcriptional regulator n=1 Tax=Actinomadura madurae TaxID=1993 RepID=UPI003FD7DF6B
MDTRPMRADARRNYERLITTARVAFMENGTGASLDDIAKRAGVGSGTLYRHFPTRDALLHAVLRERIDGLLAHAEELLADPDPDAALGLWLRTYLSGAATPRGTSTVIIEAMSAEWADTGLGAAAAAICEALGPAAGPRAARGSDPPRHRPGRPAAAHQRDRRRVRAHARPRGVRRADARAPLRRPAHGVGAALFR